MIKDLIKRAFLNSEIGDRFLTNLITKHNLHKRRNMRRFKGEVKRKFSEFDQKIDVIVGFGSLSIVITCFNFE